MSRWRQIAMEEVPSCKTSIEQAKDPLNMWCALWDEYSGGNFDPIKDGQIYRFAALCSRTSQRKYLATSVWIFFDYAIGSVIVGNALSTPKLARQMSSEEFNRRADAMKHKFAADTISEAKQRFAALKHDAE